MSDRPHLIPWWLALMLASPVRRLVENPDATVGPLVKSGDTVLEVGPAVGFFTSALARAVGERGRVISVELQERLRAALGRRLAKQGLSERVTIRGCAADDLQIADLAATVDLVVAIHVVHEMPVPAEAIEQMAGSLRAGGRMLLLEPKGHCSQKLFDSELEWAAKAGLQKIADPPHLGRRKWQASFERPR
jgi:protein-L-isoaspartate O-methyltransferase